ncbi:MAG: PilW family protein [Gallionella sp.]
MTDTMRTCKSYWHSGFTLIELMIGLALGLIASLAIFSTISTFEAQRRATGSGSEMQQNGLLALYSIEQDMRVAGFGLIDASTKPGTMPCTQVDGADTAPVTITDGGTGSDAITTHSLRSNFGGIVTGAQAARLTSALGVSPITVDTRKAIHAGDHLLVPDAAKNCSSSAATATYPAETASGVPATTTGTPPMPINIIDLGSEAPTFTTTQYRINANNLQQSVDNGNSWNDVASNIVNMQVQYGVAAAGSQTVACWTDAVNNSTTCPGTNWSTPPAADISRIKSIRIAIVARSEQRAACTTTTNANKPVTWTGGPAITLSGNDWGCYRYKVYQTIIPIRTVIWGNLL